MLIVWKRCLLCRYGQVKIGAAFQDAYKLFDNIEVLLFFLFSKSANYCFTSKENPTALMLLCEVALGNM